MALTENDTAIDKPYPKDPDGNEINRIGKIIAGIILILVTLFTMTAIVAHWPDKLPPVDQKASTKYHYKWFAVTYTGEGGLRTDSAAISFPKKIFSIDSTKKADSISTSIHKKVDSVVKDQLPKLNKDCSKCLIDLNTLLLLLVALAGFLGNMIHVGASFIDYVGAGKFKRSWVLWYFVKPFSASALAIGVYIVFRAGFLSSSDVTVGVNLYGVTAMAILTGLFTDRATLKLKEVFEVIFQTKNKRPDGLNNPTITNISPTAFKVGTPSPIIITGTELNTSGIIVKIDDKVTTIKENDLNKTATTITFTFTPTVAGSFNVIVEANNKVLKSQPITVAP